MFCEKSLYTVPKEVFIDASIVFLSANKNPSSVIKSVHLGATLIFQNSEHAIYKMTPHQKGETIQLSAGGPVKFHWSVCRGNLSHRVTDEHFTWDLVVWFSHMRAGRLLRSFNTQNQIREMDTSVVLRRCQQVLPVWGASSKQKVVLKNAECRLRLIEFACKLDFFAWVQG